MLLNVVRILIACVCGLSLLIMILGFFRHRHDWNQKTRDYWYGRVMWSLVGISACIESITRDTPFRYTIILIAAASLATLKGNLQRGKWGNDDEGVGGLHRSKDKGTDQSDNV